MSKLTSKKFKDESAVKNALAEAISGLESNARLVDIARDDFVESHIYKEMFANTVRKIGDALRTCIEAQAAIASLRAIFGDDGLAVEEAGA